ncbi:MAG: PP2C family protein-serine/threonine phosphatase [Roseburia sp.]
MNQYIATYHTDIGIKKTTNQDSLLIKKAQTPLGEVLLVIICDGMGGLAKGEVASADVILAFSKWFDERLSGLMAAGLNDGIMRQEWSQLVIQENEKIKAYGAKCNVSLGTTITGMLFACGRYYIVHVGDSRAYQLGETLVQLTMDQTVVAREVARGILTPEQAKIDPRRSILLQCIGASESIVPDFLTGDIEEGCNYLLCCDGFRHEITPEEIFASMGPQKVSDETSMKNALYQMVEENKARQERDNISAILVHAG